MKHIRVLTTVEASTLGYPVTFTFTRAFLADNFKGIRNKLPKEAEPVQKAPTPEVAVSTKITISQEAKSFPVTPPSSTEKPAINPKKYLSLVSPILRALRGEESASESDSSSESDSIEATGYISKSQSPSILPTVNNAYKLKDTAPKSALQTTVNNSGDDVADLYKQLRCLGLPTSFGTTKKADFSFRDYEFDEQWVDTSDQVLLQFAGKFLRSSDFKRKQRHYRSRSASTSTIHFAQQDHDPVNALSRCASSDDLLAYHRGVFANLCYLLELACSFKQRGCADMNINDLNLPKAWRSSDFNLEAFLYSCKKYWRYEVPSSSRLPSTKDQTKPSDLVNLETDPVLAKYWAQRFRLFSRFNHGIQTDRDGFFSATPEAIACHQALRVKRSLVRDTNSVQTLTVIDACSGTGANSIQFALLGFRVIAVEVDPSRVAMAAHNAEIYGVRSQIEFICADFFQWAREELLRHCNHKTRPYAALFMSPPWGGPAYLDCEVFDLNGIHFDSDTAGARTFWFAVQLASQLTGGNLILFLPRNTNMAQLPRLSECIGSACLWSSESYFPLEIEVNVLNAKFKSLTVYSGALCNRTGSSIRPLPPQRLHIEPVLPSNDDDTDESEYFESIHSDSDGLYGSKDQDWSDYSDDECSSCGYMTASDS